MPNTMRRMTIIWLILIVATVCSWVLGDSRTAGADTARLAAVAILVVAMVKTRLVIIHFMDVGSAPLALRLVCEAWVVLVGAGMIGMYLFG